jgi:multicomponent Na+:H+ antiporter subunit F
MTMNILENSSAFLDNALLVAIFIMALSLIFPLIRIFNGPTLPDRIVALDQIAGIIAAIILCDVLYSKAIILLDVLLIISFILVFGSMIMARYLQKKMKEND